MRLGGSCRASHWRRNGKLHDCANRECKTVCQWPAYGCCDWFDTKAAFTWRQAALTWHQQAKRQESTTTASARRSCRTYSMREASGCIAYVDSTDSGTVARQRCSFCLSQEDCTDRVGGAGKRIAIRTKDVAASHVTLSSCLRQPK
jgi:hypothetical protein